MQHTVFEIVLSQTWGLSGNQSQRELNMLFHYGDSFIFHLFVRKLMVPSSSRPSDHTAVLEASNDMVYCPVFDAKNVGHFLVWPRVFVSIDETPFVFFADASPCYIARVLIRVVQLILYFSN